MNGENKREMFTFKTLILLQINYVIDDFLLAARVEHLEAFNVFVELIDTQ